ncbi:MAG: baseplate J/gp47 family protein [Defluviitaleaceae bacterium]|nr:baseplate J/gp47 family protein [Defluviitaleaceae bacterium]
MVLCWILTIEWGGVMAEQPEYGLTVHGFRRKPYTAIIEDKQERAKDLFGEDIDLSDRSPLGLYIQADAWEESNLWDTMEHVYFAAFIDDAEGKQLDGLVKYIGLLRHPASRSGGMIEILGRVGLILLRGTRVTTESGIVFQTMFDITLDDRGFGEVRVEAVEPGQRGNVTQGLIDRLFNPAPGIAGITNPERTGGGRPTESDEDLRERYYRSLSRKGKATRAAIEAAILEIPGVMDAIVLENYSMEIDENGLPPKSVAPFVFAGDSKDIAAAVLATKSGGIQSYGQTVLDIEDKRGYSHKIGYTQASAVTIYVEIILTRNNRFRPGYETNIRTYVIEYIGGLDVDGVEHRGLGLGQNVAHSRIIVLTHDSGISDAIVKISTDGVTYFESNVEIPIMQIANTDYTKVIVR